MSHVVREENIIDITLEDGTVVTEPDFAGRTVTSFLMYTGVPLQELQLAKQAKEFMVFVNTLEWKGKPLASKSVLLTPTPWLKKVKIGNWIGTEGVAKLVAQVDGKFTPYAYWANNNPLPAANFWSPGSWSYTNAAYFGANPDWLDSEGKILHAKALEETAEAGTSDKE